MLGLKALALRTKFGVMASVAGLLENGCKRAEIVGTYPGNVVHIVDPGHCEIFINEYTVPGMCIQHLVPWYRSTLIQDAEHTHLKVFVNDASALTVPILNLTARNAVAAEWVVTALLGTPAGGPHVDCAVHHKDDIILGIYQVVFGPASKADCTKFVKDHCTPHKF